MQQLDQRLSLHISQCLLEVFNLDLYYRATQSMKWRIRFHIGWCCRQVSRRPRLLASQPQHQICLPYFNGHCVFKCLTLYV